MEIYEFVYTSCIYESAMATLSLHKTKVGAYKAMREFLLTDYTQWYDQRIMYGKGDRKWVDKYGLHCAWAVRTIQLKE